MSTEEKTIETQEVKELIPVSENEVSTTVTDETNPEQPPLTKEEQLNELINHRMGNFDITISYSDLKYIRNSLNDKVEWKGPNEAYLLLIANLSLTNTLTSMDQKIKEPVKIPLNSAVLESINYFFSKISGKGTETAQRIFGVSMILRPALESIKKLDSVINSLKEELNPEKSK